MTPFLLLYYALLVIWLPLLWPALRLSGWRRVVLLIVAGCGLAAALYEARLWAGTMPSIRLDIPLISLALGFLYGSAAAVLFGVRWLKAAAALGLVLMAIAGVMAYEWISISRESQRLREVFRERDTLLFEARFRDPETYEQRFGPFGPAAHPVGHWAAPDDWQYSRLIINGHGRAWLFYRCEMTECPLLSDESAVEPVGAESGKAWQVTVDERAIAPRTLRITQAGPDHLSVQFEKRSLDFFKAPPPIDPAPARRSLTYLGSFAGMICNNRRSHADIRQLWLWREKERHYGVGIFVNRIPGLRADFVSPVVIGEGLRDGDGRVFAWQRDERPWSASVILEGAGAQLELRRPGRPPERIALEGRPLFRDEAIELAPLTSKADWDHWFETVLTGHFSSGGVPDC